MKPTQTIRGVDVYEGFLDRGGQARVVEDIRGVAEVAPLFSPMTPYGKPMRVKMTSAGTYGWYSDRKGYRYERQHPDGQDWPAIPESVLAIWRALVSEERMPGLLPGELL